MNNSNKYFYLMWLLMASVFGFAAIVAILFFVLKLFAITLFNIPGSGYVFELSITAIPYFILFAAYYIVHRTISSSKTNLASVIARILLTVGSLLCIIQLVCSLFVFFKSESSLLSFYREYSYLNFPSHLIFVLLTAGVLALGAPKEKNWMERKADQ